LFKCYLVILSVELCLGKLWEIPSTHAQNYFNCMKNTRVLGIPINHTLSYYLPPDFFIIPIAVLSGLSNVDVTPPSNNTLYTEL
jgi:hypothetical protein